MNSARITSIFIRMNGASRYQGLVGVFPQGAIAHSRLRHKKLTTSIGLGLKSWLNRLRSSSSLPIKDIRQRFVYFPFSAAFISRLQPSLYFKHPIAIACEARATFL
jgi:hypothetical protein